MLDKEHFEFTKSAVIPPIETLPSMQGLGASDPQIIKGYSHTFGGAASAQKR